MIDSSGNTSSKRLFLVCPTDSIEFYIRKKFTGEAFFYTALGVYVKFDTQTQYNLWDLICKHGIGQIIIVCSVNNVFYRRAFEKQKRHNYPVDKAIAKVLKKVSGHLEGSELFFQNFHLIAAHHITNQKKRLISTHYLGDQLTGNNIAVKAYIFQPQEKVFYSPEEIEKRGNLLSILSHN